ncbi:MAG: hypothetical protein V1685_04060 [Parcubacteria group bacterium]
MARYLKGRGYQTNFAGIRIEAAIPLSQKTINWADVVVLVHKAIREGFPKAMTLDKKKVIVIDVDDRPEKILPEKKCLEGEAWLAFQKKYVYPKLELQINQYFPSRIAV